MRSHLPMFGKKFFLLLKSGCRGLRLTLKVRVGTPERKPYIFLCVFSFVLSPTTYFKMVANIFCSEHNPLASAKPNLESVIDLFSAEYSVTGSNRKEKEVNLYKCFTDMLESCFYSGLC